VYLAKNSSVRWADSFSAKATLISWFRATPSAWAKAFASSIRVGWSRNAKLLDLMGVHPFQGFGWTQRQNAKSCSDGQKIPRIESHDCVRLSMVRSLKYEFVVRVYKLRS
jgi:hypothetical protein